MYEAQMKLEIVKTNISDLVEWLDVNNKMDLIPDELWKYIINIEKAVGIWDEGHEEPEYDSAGFTEEDRIVNGQYRNMYKDTDPDLVQLERATPYEKYVAEVKQNIDLAVQEGILRDTGDYNYLSKESFDHRCKTDLEFAAQWGDPNWLFPGEPLHDDPDMDTQDWTLQTR